MSSTSVLLNLSASPGLRDTRVGDAKPANVRLDAAQRSADAARRSDKLDVIVAVGYHRKALTRRPRNPRAHAATSSNSLEGLHREYRSLASRVSVTRFYPRARRAETCASPLDRARASLPLPLRRSRAVRARDPLREQAPRFRQCACPSSWSSASAHHLSELAILKSASAQIANRANSSWMSTVLTPPGEANHPPSTRTPDGEPTPPPLFGRRDHVVP